MYAQQATKQSFLQNLAAGGGGALYGMGNLGPRSLVGMDNPGEVEDWKKSMSGLGTTVGGTVGQVLGYGAPGAVLAPMLGASVPVAAGVGAVEGLMMPAENLPERARNTGISTVMSGFGQAGGNALAQRATKSAAQKASDIARLKAQRATRDASLKTIQDAGYSVTPSQANAGLFPRFMEGISGKYKTEQAMGLKNQPLTNKAAARALNMPEDAALSDAVLDSFREVVEEPYRKVAALPKRQQVTAKSNYMDWNQPTQGVKGFDPATSLQDLKEARYKAKLLWKGANQGNPGALELARETDNVAKNIENQIEQYAIENGDDELVNALRASRKEIAKSHTIEKALNDTTGDVDAVALGNELTRGNLIPDELMAAGKLGQGFREVARVPKSGDASPITALDWILGSGLAGTAAMMTNPAALALGTLPAATRIGLREALKSKAVQKSLVQPKYSQGLVNRTMPGLLSNRLSPALYQGAGIYGYGVEPFEE